VRIKSQPQLLCCSLLASMLASCASTSRLWQLQQSATAGTAIVAQLAGREFRIACRLNPPSLHVTIDGVRPAPHAQNLEVRSGGHVAVLPLVPSVRSRRVEAAGPVPETFLFMLNSNSPITISSAGRTFYLESLDEPTREAFAVACGKSAGIYVPPPR